MVKTRILLIGLILYIALACGGTVPLSAPSPTPGSIDASVPSASPAQPTDTLAAPQPPLQKITVPGLRVVCVIAGDVWLWEDGAQIRQLTHTGGVTKVSISVDGLKIAFSRNGEIWIIQADGDSERLLVPQAYLAALQLEGFDWFPGREMLFFSTSSGNGIATHLVDLNGGKPYQWLQPGEGGRLSVSPSGSLVAISNAERIDLIDLNTANRTTLLTYPRIASGNGLFPEVVWSPDSTGFKTVVPPGAGGGPAQLYFVFVNGRVASLGTFDLVPLRTSWPYLSPDGGYVLYVKESVDGWEQTYVMDSSGASKAYGQPAQRIRALGWSPDSKRFAFSRDNPAATVLAALDGSISSGYPHVATVKWVDQRHVLMWQSPNADLHLYNLEGEVFVVGQQVTDFDEILLQR